MPKFPSLLGLSDIILLYISYFLYPPIDGHLGSFCLLAVVTNATDTIVQILVQVSAFTSCVYTQKWIARSRGNSMCDFLRNHHIVFYTGSIILYSRRIVTLNCPQHYVCKVCRHWCVLAGHLFSVLHSIPLCKCATVFLAIVLLMSIWVISSLWLLQVLLLPRYVLQWDL